MNTLDFYEMNDFLTNIFFLRIQNIHSKHIFIFLKSRIFIQENYSFFQNPEYSFKANIRFFLKEAVSARARSRGAC